MYKTFAYRKGDFGDQGRGENQLRFKRRLALDLCAAAAGMFGAAPAEKLLKSCAGTMNILLSFLVFTGVILTGTLACSMGGGVS